MRRGSRKRKSAELCVRHRRPGSGAAPSRKETPAVGWPRLPAPPSWLGAAVAPQRGGAGVAALPCPLFLLRGAPFSFSLLPSLAWASGCGQVGPSSAVEGPALAGRGERGLGRRGEPMRELKEQGGLDRLPPSLPRPDGDPWRAAGSL